MSGQDETREYSTVDLRKNLGQALGRAHFQNEIVKISHHGRPYASVVSNEDAEVLESMKKLATIRGMSIVEIVPLIEQMVTEDGVNLPADPLSRTRRIAP